MHPDTALALGAFDGLHRGHMAVIAAALRSEFLPAVFTFRAPPSGCPVVLTPEDKELLLRRAGIRQIHSVDFAQVKAMEAREFGERVLFGELRARRICCGEDFRFGRGASGGVELLEELCRAHGAELAVVPPVEEGGEKISSTRIRRAVEAGEIPLANRLLGRAFGFAQEVVHGNHIGTGLGSPTLNQPLPQGFARPRFGVYAAWCQVEGQLHWGVCNIGVKPTVGSRQVLAETWMPGFSGDLYGKTVRLSLLEFIRAEKKFASLEELKEEIRRNAAQAREIAQRGRELVEASPF